MSFFFSSRRRHTRLQGDWSSDVCSSDLAKAFFGQFEDRPHEFGHRIVQIQYDFGAEKLWYYGAEDENVGHVVYMDEIVRSEERRVGKECRSRWSPYH